MKVLSIISVLVLGLCSGCGGGGGSTTATAEAQTTGNMTITNNPLNVSTALPDPLNIKVTDIPNYTEKREVANSYLICGFPQDTTLYSVPAGKTFILTDINYTDTATILKNGQKVLSLGIINYNLMGGPTPFVHFSSGYSFENGTAVVVAQGSAGCISVAGYLISAT